MRGNVESLPKWARQEIASLEQRNASLERQVEELTNTPLVQADRYGDYNWQSPCRLRFAGGFSVRPTPKGLEVRHEEGQALIIRPQVSNAIQIKTEEQFA